MKKEGGSGAINFAARAQELKERRAQAEAGDVKTPAKIAPAPAASEKPEGSLVRLEIPKAPLRIVPQPDRFEAPPAFSTAASGSEQQGTTRSGLNMRMLSRLDLGDHVLGLQSLNLIGRDFLGLLTTPEDRQKFDRLVVIETALDGLYVKPANVDLRRSIIRSYGTKDLAADFWGSTERNWTAQPAMYVAILAELEERGFFSIANVTPPPPTPPAAPTGRRPRRGKKRQA